MEKPVERVGLNVSRMKTRHHMIRVKQNLEKLIQLEKNQQSEKNCKLNKRITPKAGRISTPGHRKPVSLPRNWEANRRNRWITFVRLDRLRTNVSKRILRKGSSALMNKNWSYMIWKQISTLAESVARDQAQITALQNESLDPELETLRAWKQSRQYVESESGNQKTLTESARWFIISWN